MTDELDAPNRQTEFEIAGAELLSALNSRERLVQFHEVLVTISLASPRSAISAFTRQRKLVEGTADLEKDGYIIYPFYSFTISAGSYKQLHTMAKAKRASLLKSLPNSELFLSSEFAMIGGQLDDNETIRVIHNILHAYFASQVLELCVERSARRLVKNSGEENGGYLSQNRLIKKLNHKIFNIQTAFISSHDPDKIRFQPSRLPRELFPDDNLLLELVRETSKFSESRTLRYDFEDRPVMLLAIPLRHSLPFQVSDLMLLRSSEAEFPLIAAKLNEALVRISEEKFAKRGRQEFELELQQRVIEAPRETAVRADAFTEFCDWVTGELLRLTNSHSVTIRRLTPFTNALELISKGIPSDREDNTENDIRSDPSSSVNFFTFSNDCLPYTYLADVGNIPEKYKKLGLVSVRATRSCTKSEVCLPIGKQPLRLGTINLESEYFAAYGPDIEFLQGVAFHLAQFWGSLGRRDDAWWLSQLSLTHLATHELRDFKETLKAPQKQVLENIVSTISTRDYFEEKRQTWDDFLSFIEKSHSRLLSEERFLEIWSFEGIDADAEIDSRFLGSLRVIVVCILNNTKHSIYVKNRIRLVRERRAEASVVTITYDSKVNYFTLESIQEFERRFSEPTLSADGWHFGLFLIGVHSRLLGGDIEINPDCKKEIGSGPFSYMVRLIEPSPIHD